MVEVTKKEFGKCNGKDASLFTISNGEITCSVTDCGATLVSLIVPDKNGKMGDIALGYDSADEYLTNGGSVGATIGRVANRIADGKFTLNGTEYTLGINEEAKNNSSHGGFNKDRFSLDLWEHKILDNGVLFTYKSPDGQGGYPGNLTAEARYTVDGKNLHVDYFATTDQDTLVNLTNHAYFNLKDHAGDDFSTHDWEMHADLMAWTDERSLPKPFVPAEKVAFEKLDHHYIYDKDGQYSKEQRKMVTFSESTSGRVMEIHGTAPSIVTYNASGLKDTKGKNGVTYKAFGSACFETQSITNAVEHMVLKPGEKYENYTTWKFSTK